MHEEIAELGDFRYLLVVDFCGGVLDVAGEKVEGVYDYIVGSDLWLGEVAVEYLDGVGDDY